MFSPKDTIKQLYSREYNVVKQKHTTQIVNETDMH